MVERERGRDTVSRQLQRERAPPAHGDIAANGYSEAA